MSSVMRTALSALLLVATARVTAAEESAAARARALPGTLGLTGMRDLVDARIPKVLSVRAGLRYGLLVQDQDFDGAVDAAREREVHVVDTYAGASAFGLLDASIRVPFVYDHDDVDVSGTIDQVNARYEQGFANLDVAGKVAFDLGPISLAPYASGRLPTGDGSLEDLASFEFGAAATFTIFNEYLAIHGNVSGLTVEEGLQALRYRVGVSVVPLATDFLLLRVYGYGDGIEYEGQADSDFDLDFGAQAIIFKFITVELGFGVRIVDADFISETLEDDLEAEGIFERHFDDEGTWTLQLGAGLVFDF